MQTEIIYKRAETPEELHGILSLQAQNKEDVIPQEEILNEGFVYVNHDIQVLGKMNAKHPQIIAVVNKHVVGYALIMDNSLKNEIPSLVPMFDMINQCQFQNRTILTAEYIIMGQICIAKPYRRMGIFRGLYEKMKKTVGDQFKYIITEIAIRNQRSLQAHIAVGFSEIQRYFDTEGEYWSIVLLETSRSNP